LYELALTLSNHGRARNQPKQFGPDVVGFKYKMSNIQAAIGCAQLERIDELIDRKRAIMEHYRDKLGGLPGVLLNPEPAHTVIGAWMPTAVFDPKSNITTPQLQKLFAAENIDARVFFHPLSSLPMFDRKPENGLAYSIAERAINLPSYHDIDTEALDRVCEVVLEVSSSNRLPMQ